jgi:sigma-54 specific flagellar transcriptional regulator A
MIGQSRVMRELRSLVRTMAASPSTVLISGESGTGKELVAQALHAEGPRRDGPFVPVNCGAIPRDLLESELFGHRRGAFTGALGDRVGRFELAHGGTLFLDEIGDLPLELQVKLLRVLQERRIEPLGGSRSVPIDVRVVAATHRDLEGEVAAGQFRQDLYYRLNVLPVRTSALRERLDDLPELIAFLAARFAAPSAPPVRIAADLMQAFRAYHWPGNIRELSNLIDRFSTLYAGETVSLHGMPDWLLPAGLVRLRADIGPEAPERAGGGLRLVPATDPTVQASLARAGALEAGEQPTLDPHALDESCLDHTLDGQLRPVPGSTSAVEEAVLRAQGIEPLHPGGISLRDRMIDIERGYIEQALEQTQWNVSRTARLLSLQRTTLIEKMSKYRLRRG